MGIRTGKITYNVNERGRTHTGQPRNFDTKALAKLINAPATQERVANGDIQGYYGHWPRLKFGMATQEGGMLDGQVISLPIAVKTVYLSADEDGNVTHEEEFLDTAEGQLAQKMWESKTGGFSSAIDAKPGGYPSVPTAFHAFDFVLSPNVSNNRGYQAIMDSVTSGDEAERADALAFLQAVAEEEAAKAHQYAELLDAANVELTAAKESAALLDTVRADLAAAQEKAGLLDAAQAELATAKEAVATLDSVRAELVVAQEKAALLDGVQSQLASALEKATLLDSISTQLAETQALLARTAQENDLLVSRLAAATTQEPEQVLDAVRHEPAIAPGRSGKSSVTDFKRYRDMPLAALQELDDGKGDRGTQRVEDVYIQRR